jgi:hypothetical protein
MGLYVTLKENYDAIGRLEIVRTTNTGSTPGPDAVSRYVVRKDGSQLGYVDHRYGDGAWVLVRKALELT